MSHDQDNDGGIVTLEATKTESLNRSEIEQQVSTARKFPRSVKRFLEDVRGMVTMSIEIADSCIFALPRFEKGERKTIEGPSVRFAEMILVNWRNTRTATRLVDIGDRHLTAQAVFHDLESNNAISIEVQRGIWGKYGRFSDDMVIVTANAAASIAMRNAILKGIPQSLWSAAYDDAKKTSIGTGTTFIAVRDKALAVCQKHGAAIEVVLARFGRANVEDMTGGDIVTIKGLLSAIREGEATVEDAFDMTGGRGRTEPAAETTGPRRKSESAAKAMKEDDKAADVVKPTSAEAEPELPKAAAVEDAKATPPIDAPTTLAGLMRRVESAKALDELVEIQVIGVRTLTTSEQRVLQGAITNQAGVITNADDIGAGVDAAGGSEPAGQDPIVKFAEDVSQVQRTNILRKLETLDTVEFTVAFPEVSLANFAQVMVWIREKKAG
jgi:hypothetical protein